MKTIKLVVSLGAAAVMAACSSQSATRAGPDAKPVSANSNPDHPSAVAKGAGTEVGVESTRTGDADGLEKWTNINYAKEQPKYDEKNTTPTTTLIYINTMAAKTCSLGDTSVYFAYDSAKVNEDAKNRMMRLADCLKKTDKHVEVAGYADPRGTDSYNKDLGMSRAESVTKVLTKHGVPNKRVMTKSEGEVGSEENQAMWPMARRVDIDIVDNG